MNHRILEGSLLDRLPELLPDSVDSIVTDPPYHLTTGKKGGTGEASLNLNSPAGRSRVTTGFMGKEWDGGDVAFRPETWIAAMRVLKPGGYLLAFGGTRTYHRLVCAIEDAGFEIRDQIGWVFGSGFPKSHNLHGEWEGWGTALKPAWEPICVARKPFKGTVAENVLRYGTGAINIAGCRIEGEPVPINRLEKWSGFGQEKRPEYEQEISSLGRWPANLIHDGSDEVLAAFPETTSGSISVHHVRSTSKTKNAYGERAAPPEETAGSTGSAARFFYCAKASREDRNEGCKTNNHPTVKPTNLMRYLCRLVTPPGGTVLDCFMGSGSTLKAALLEGFDFIGIDKEAEYCAIAKARADHVLETDSPLLRQLEIA